MTSRAPSPWSPILTAFTIWFAHFMICWASAEIWPEQWHANVLAWAVTAIALLALALHGAQVRRRRAAGRLSARGCRFARGAIALSTVAVLFSALPSAVFVP